MISRIAPRENPVLTRWPGEVHASRTGRIESCEGDVEGGVDDLGSSTSMVLVFVATPKRVPSGDQANDDT